MMVLSNRILLVLAWTACLIAASTSGVRAQTTNKNVTSNAALQEERFDNSDADHDEDDRDDDSNHPNFRPHVPIVNNSPAPVEIVWHAADKTLTPPEGIASGGVFHVYTYVGERFDVFEVPSTRRGKCRDSPSRDDDEDDSDAEQDDNDEEEDDLDNNYDYEHCWQTSFVISTGREIEVVVDSDFVATVTDEIVLADKDAREALADCDANDDHSQVFLRCLEDQTTRTLESWQAEWQYHRAAWQRMESLLEPYVGVTSRELAEEEPLTEICRE